MSRVCPDGYLLLLLALLAAGCGSPRVFKTVAVSGLPPVTADQVVVFESDKATLRPHEIVGKVMVVRREGGVSQKYAFQRMREAAAEMGADAVAHVKQGYATGQSPEIFYSGQALKWLGAGAEKHVRTVPFMVAILPIPEDAEAKGDQTEINKAAYQGAMGALELKGYFVLPAESVGLKSPARGLEGLKELADDQLRLVGGPEADCLLELSILSRAQVHVLIGASAAVGMKARLMEKATRKILYEGEGTGSAYAGWLLNLGAPNVKRAAAAQGGAAGALLQLKPICTLVETKK